jgi:hypothetical protein
MVGIGMGKLGNHFKDKVAITQIIVISIIFLGIALLPLWVTKSPQAKILEIKNINDIGLPPNVVNELKNLLKP